LKEGPAVRDESRPSPEEFLDRIRAEGRGELRVYLGAAPGVGKTFTMLQDARLLKEHGVDVVVGIIDTHKRPDTAALLDSLEQVPLNRQQYRGIWVEELDVPAVLARHPMCDTALLTAQPAGSGSLYSLARERRGPIDGRSAA
jgi:two-component system sensor histidine kinase KdpD